MIKYLLAFFFLISIQDFIEYSENTLPVYFPEYGVTINRISKLSDTLTYNKSSKENFRFVFFNNKGKSYCERYLGGKLYQKGYYENSLDTLKRYVSGRFSDGQKSSIRIQQYFQPLKNGEWITYKDKRELKQVYLM